MAAVNHPPAVVLLTDFGTDDTYVGQMKGVILTIAPETRIIDLTHAVTPQDVTEGAFLLERALPYLPPESIVIAVIDPGVGTRRRAIAVEAGGRRFLAPDNGLLTPILLKNGPVQCVEVTNRRYIAPERSRTFHGRDIFSPAAAHLATGIALNTLGAAIEPADCMKLPMPGCTALGIGVWEGGVIFSDRFGNLVTSIDSSLAAEKDQWRLVLPDGTALPVRETYGNVPEGEPLAYRGSFGTLEVGVRDASALERFGLNRGEKVRLERL
ncbi:SAM hydrolase/SAM-dependent halogenase family protein [Pelodictyon luteolum]|uniref:SAM-dependent chlorinase/fluorinase n=1 Tax=Chlorobium luteolum (strain DSM 273 / BCRC 81028 / 2530) TaxID=319225 RepID=Q3B5V5_CHLL3|nr:SAM-dependent chlorinase/fluorinase [Pelodictyon luteolum]ABB23276.1 conserved hypothetical protein [Pelodictyon luteolum DSM 273]